MRCLSQRGSSQTHELSEELDHVRQVARLCGYYVYRMNMIAHVGVAVEWLESGRYLVLSLMTPWTEILAATQAKANNSRPWRERTSQPPCRHYDHLHVKLAKARYLYSI